jgi:hypothetical protein
MISLFKRKELLPASSRLFRLTIHVQRGSYAEMPANVAGAYVPIFVGAADHEVAAKVAVANLVKRGLEFVGIADNQIHELDPHKWDQFVRDAWPEFAEYFPSQQQVLKDLGNGFLHVGPFASYESPDAV